MGKLSCLCGPKCKCRNCTCGPQAFIFDTLGSTTRLAILEQLRKKSSTVSELVEQTKIEQTLVSHSLRRLEAAGFATKRTSGRNRIYALNNVAVQPLMKLINAHVREYSTKTTKHCLCAADGAHT